MDLETRALAAYIGKVITDVRSVLDRTQADRFEIGLGVPEPSAYPHVMGLTEPLDCTGAALVAEELNKAFWFDPRHVHRAAPRASGETQAVYLAWTGRGYPGRHPFSGR
jgi:hypothetical protein